ncbi:hypothetical protein QYE76_047055 [Lolium multiflorum]|uniref:CCHC-type domain-containing protein n=1 Tax=Lolium multiflorum TaxID=4521 RepID=A0AAD8WYX6_LOLMU|nr:hypothetical protein QYE76_047055 [Lolium multiflorum]
MAGPSGSGYRNCKWVNDPKSDPEAGYKRARKHRPHGKGGKGKNKDKDEDSSEAMDEDDASPDPKEGSAAKPNPFVKKSAGAYHTFLGTPTVRASKSALRILNATAGCAAECYALVVSPRIDDYDFSKCLVDGGASLNIMYLETLERMNLTKEQLKHSTTEFHGVVPGKKASSLGSIRLPVAFGDINNFHEEMITFEVVPFKSSYHVIFGRSTYHKFHARACYIYNKLKIPGPNGMITVSGDYKKAHECELGEAAFAESVISGEELQGYRATVDPKEMNTTKKQVSEQKTSFKAAIETKKIDFKEGDTTKQPSDMSGVPRELAEHYLNINSGAKPVKQAMRRFGDKKRRAIGMELANCSVELWEIIVHGYRKPHDPVRLTSTEFYNRQLNASARDKIRSGINRKLLDQVNDIESAKELWDRIVVLQEGTDLIQSALYETAKQEAHQFMIREGESVADAYARLGALRVRVKGLGVEKYNDGFEMNEAFIKSKVIAMIAVKQQDTNLALNLQIMTKSADLNSDDLVSYVAANENMAKAGKRLMAMNRVDEASHNHEVSHNLALKARGDHGREEDYEIEEDEEMTSTSDIATDFAFFAKKYKGKLPMLFNDKKKKRTCYNCDEDSHFANECPYEKRVDKPKFIKGVKPRLKPNPINDRYKKNKGRSFVGAEYLSDEEEEDEEEEAGVAGFL